MRNPKRIEPYVTQIFDCWKRNPDERFVTFVIDSINKSLKKLESKGYYADVFYLEDNLLIPSAFDASDIPDGLELKISSERQKKMTEQIQILRQCWEQLPDWRFGQFITNTIDAIGARKKYTDYHQLTDEDFFGFLENFLSKEKEKQVK